MTTFTRGLARAFLSLTAAVMVTMPLNSGIAQSQRPASVASACPSPGAGAAYGGIVAPWKPGTVASYRASARDLAISSPFGAIAATLTTPQGLARPPIVLVLHGYEGNRNETVVAQTGERMFERTARLFAEKGLATLRFDFINSGQSPGRWQDTTFSGQADDVHVVLDHVARMGEIDQRHIGLLGYSQGGLVALKAAAREQRVGAVTLWNPVLDPERTYGHILSASALQRGYDQFRTHDLKRLVAGTRLLPSFMYEVKTTYPLVDGQSFAGPVLVVGGRRDAVAGPVDELAALLARAREGRRTDVIMVDGDHGFNRASTPIVLDQAIGCSAQFFDNVFRSG